jgi:hypothetical protein
MDKKNLRRNFYMMTGAYVALMDDNKLADMEDFLDEIEKLLDKAK